MTQKMTNQSSSYDENPESKEIEEMYSKGRDYFISVQKASHIKNK